MEPAPAPFLIRKEPAPSLAALRWRLTPSAPYSARRTTHRCFLARNAIYQGVSALGLGSGDRVLAPAYICRAAVDPIVARGIGVDFYRVGRGCDADIADVESRIGQDTRALLLVHYFGFAQKMAPIVDLCHRRSLFLIEDCAHVFGAIPGLTLGTRGDISVFSWRKFLPLFDGGDLVINRESAFSPTWDRESALFTLKVAKNVFDQWAVGRPWTHGLDGLAQLLKRSLFANKRGRSVATALDADTGSVDFDLRFAAMPMSRLSRWMLAHCDAERVIATRRANYRGLAELLAGTGTQSLFPHLPDDTCPWVFPALIGTRPDAHLELRARGIPAVTWGGVRPDGLRAGDHPEADYLYEHVVFLPIHQDLGTEDIRRIAEHVRSVALS